MPRSPPSAPLASQPPAGAPLAEVESSTRARQGQWPAVTVHAQHVRLPPMASWQIWALSSAVFAALTAVFAKVGIEHVSPDVATLIRTAVILIVLTLLVGATRQFPQVF